MNSAWTTKPTAAVVKVEDDAETLALKVRFAEALLRDPLNSFRAACVVCGNDTVRALKISSEWVYDLCVLQEQARLIEENGPDEYLPTKAEVCRRIYAVGENATSGDEKLKAYKLYAEIRSFIAKPEGGNVNVQVNNNRVMVMRDFGTDEQWETKAIAQQTKLIEHSRD